VTFLDLVQNLWAESGTGGPEPYTVSGQVGELMRLVMWIHRADLEIQRAHNDWDFLWVPTSLLTVEGQQDYAPPADDIGVYDEESLYMDDGAALDVAHYLTMKGAPFDSTPGAPYRVTLLPDKGLRLEAVPDAEYTIKFDYFREPVPMEIDDDAISIIPEAYHNAILGRALMMYAQYENAPEAMQSGQQMYIEWMSSLQSRHLPGHRDMHRQAEGNFFRVEVE